MKEVNFKLKCVTLLNGGAADWGKHLLMPNVVTLCGQPTPEAIEHHPTLNDPVFNDLISNYKEEIWDITCDKCIEMYKIFKKPIIES